MTLDECTPGRAVWARTGSYGWRPAIVQSVGRKLVRVQFLTGGARNHGTRHTLELRPRDPLLKGGDKPTPEEAAACPSPRYQENTHA